MDYTVAVLSPKKGDIVLFRVSDHADPEELSEKVRTLRTALDAAGNAEIPLIVVSREEDIKLLREADMRKLGWQRTR